MAQYFLSANHFNYDIISAVHQVSYMAEIKTDENASEALYEDPTDDVSRYF